VGHSLGHDFQSLEMPEALRPKEMIRDLVKFKKYQSSTPVQNMLPSKNGAPPSSVTKINHGAKSLKKLTKEYLGLSI